LNLYYPDSIIVAAERDTRRAADRHLSVKAAGRARRSPHGSGGPAAGDKGWVLLAGEQTTREGIPDAGLSSGRRLER